MQLSPRSYALPPLFLGSRSQNSGAVRYSSGQDTVNVPKSLSLLAKRVPRPSDTASLYENSPRR